MIDVAFIHPVLFVRWRQRCELRDVERIEREVDTASRRHQGAGIAFVAIVPADVPPPDASVRAAILEGTEYAAKRCRSIHVAIEGEGARRASIRSVAAGLRLASGGSFEVHRSVSEALDRAAQYVAFDAFACYRRAKALGLVGDVHE
jgi:hypothetical protein